jgi:hypothetical protein
MRVAGNDAAIAQASERTNPACTAHGRIESMAENMVDRLEIDLIDVPDDERSWLASELRDYLIDEDPTLSVHQVRSDPRTQDFGATLLLTVGPPVALALARGLQKWLAARNTSTVLVKCGKDKEVRVTNVSGRRADDLARQLSSLCDG